MTTETIAEFLARGGSVEKSTKTVNLSELLLKEGLLNHNDAENVTQNLNETLQSSLDQLVVTTDA